MNNLLTRYFRLLGYLLVLAVLNQLISPAPKANATQTTYKVGDTTKTGGTVFYVLPPETRNTRRNHPRGLGPVWLYRRVGLR